MKQEPLDHHLLGKSWEGFETYRSFLNEEEAKDFTNFLREHNVPFSLESSGTVIDSVFVGDGLVPKVVLKIPVDDFKRVRDLITQQIRDLSAEELEGHYLNDLDNDELREIIEKPDEWTVENIAIAKVLLEQRGVEIATEELKEIERQRDHQLEQGKKGDRLSMVLYGLGILAGVFFFVYMSDAGIFLTFAGIGMAVYYAYGKDTDLNGNKRFIYDAPTRILGKVMLFGGVLATIVALLFIFGVFPMK
ncbi:MAG: hypothetical protein AAFN81_24680 [Bacteroidota bacterium]